MSPPYFRQLIFLLIGLSTCIVFPQSLVEYLPGFPGKLPFKLETGYIGVGESEDLQVFYYFTESERSPVNDPLLLWISGGPGCSGFTALAYELGPLMFNYTKISSSIPSLVLNPYSWSKLSNIIYIDQPVGTGFTYSKSGVYESNDTLSGNLVYEFLQKWIIDHPKFQKNPLYVAGASFGGIIVPLVVDHVYNGIKAGSQPRLNMKGYILGNPITDYFVNYNGRIPYAHRRGLLSDELYMSAKENCNGNYVSADPRNHLCKNDLEKINKCVEKICMAQILEPWCDIVSGKRELLSHHMSSEDELNARRFLQSSAPLLGKSWCREKMNSLYSHRWANKKIVQEALHVREGTINEWLLCNYTMRDTTCTLNVKSVVSYHKKFTSQSHCRVLIFSGDLDMGVPHSTTEEWIRSLKMRIKSDWSPWFVEGQVGGYKTTYFNRDSDFTYATVKGAGHTAPEYNPMESYSMFETWLSGTLV